MEKLDLFENQLKQTQISVDEFQKQSMLSIEFKAYSPSGFAKKSNSNESIANGIVGISKFFVILRFEKLMTFSTPFRILPFQQRGVLLNIKLMAFLTVNTSRRRSRDFIIFKQLLAGLLAITLICQCKFQTIIESLL